MSTYNGEKYLQTQLDSILAQQGVEVQILVRDDGSIDGTLQILEHYKQSGKLLYYTGLNLKPAKSFMDLIRQAPQAEYYAFCDQDDYWLPQKLLKAVTMMEKINSEDIPVLYHGKTTLVDSNLKFINLSTTPYTICSFPQSLILYTAIGCTFVFNWKLLHTIQQYTPSFQISHDNWLDQVCRAVNGKVLYDSNSYVYYRQHSNNVSGGIHSWDKICKRKWKNLIQSPCIRSKSVDELVKGYGTMMSIDNLEICKKILSYKTNWKSKYILLSEKKMRTGIRMWDLNYMISVILGIF